MLSSRRHIVPSLAIVALLILSACGTDDGSSGGEVDVAAITETEPSLAAGQSSPGPIDDDEDHDDDGAASGLGAHEHGAAELTVAWAGGDMVIDLISPTFNIFGFEYEATSDEDLAIVADRLDAVSAPDVIVVNEEAGCSLADDVATDLEYEGSHAELTVSWILVCANPDDIDEVDAAGLFAALPNLQDLDVEWASDAGQSSAELSPSATVLRLG